ncbi:hypothetical protein HMI56_004251, partial [Coelomomyces lativittatus]
KKKKKDTSSCSAHQAEKGGGVVGYELFLCTKSVLTHLILHESILPSSSHQL